MKWFKRTYVSIVFVCIVVGFLTPVSYAKPPSDRCILLKAQVANKDDYETLVKMDIDIWEFQQDGVIGRVTDNERKLIQENGFVVEIITEDVYEYLEKIRKEQISLFAEPTSAKYHSYDEVIADFKALEVSGVAQTYIIGSTHEGRDILAIKISDNPSEDENEPGALFLGCHHALEWISVEVPYYLAHYLVNNYEADLEVKRLIDNCEIWVVPIVNPDGYVYTWTTDRLWRKNRRDNGNGTFGVDLNRNYGYMWGLSGSSGNPSNWNYRGPSAFSEPETQAIRDLILASEFRITMSYHSYGQLLYWPWGYTFDPCPDDAPMSAMSYNMKELIQEISGSIYTLWAEWKEKFLVSGDTGDWPYGELGIYSFGTELRPETADQGGPVLPEGQILPTCEENLPVALYLISLSVADGGIDNINTGLTYGSLQFAVNDANDGDEILIQPGVYHESVYFLDKRLTLRSIDPNDPNLAASTVVNGYHRGSAVTTSGTGDEPCVLAGLTIIGEAVGVSCCDASPMIVHCTVESNGPNVIEFWEGYEPTIIDCNILGDVVQVNDPRIIAYWKLDEAEGMVVKDSAGENDGYALGDPIWQPDSGQVDGALQLDGVDDYVVTGAAPNPEKESYSVLAWIKGGAPGQVVVSQMGKANWLGADPSEGFLMTELTMAGRNSCSLASEAVITDGNWHRIGFVWDGSYRRLYVDGVVVAEDVQDNLDISVNGLYIGTGEAMEAGTYWSGLIDDVRIYNRAVKP